MKAKPNKWTDKEIKLLKKHYEHSFPSELVKFFPNRDNESIRTKANRLGLRKKIQTRAKPRVWTAKKRARFVKLYPDTNNETLARTFEVTLNAIKNAATSFNVRKSEAFMSDPKNTGAFLKGSVPHNKGKKGIAFPGSEKGWFKKGNITHNHREVGSRRKDVKDGYWLEKIAEPAEWQLVHRIVWEKHKGPIPEHHVVNFIDGNLDNCDDINNLKLVSYIDAAERMRESFGFAARCVELDKEKRQYIIENVPELVELKQQQLLLSKTLK